MKLPILFAILTSLALADSNCGTPKSDACDDTILACCDTALQQSWGIICTQHIYEQPDCTDQPINDYFNNSATALKICRGYNDFKTCVGNTRKCMSYEHFLEDGYPVAQAKSDEAAYNQLNFLCGAAFTRNAAVFSDLFNKNSRDIGLCGFNFRNRARKQPKRSCEYLQEFVSCLQKNFIADGEAAWFMCEFARAYGSPFAMHCEVNCNSEP